MIISSGSFNGFTLYDGDQIIANKNTTGSSETGDWDTVEIHQSETDPVFSASSAF